MVETMYNIIYSRYKTKLVNYHESEEAYMEIEKLLYEKQYLLYIIDLSPSYSTNDSATMSSALGQA